MIKLKQITIIYLIVLAALLILAALLTWQVLSLNTRAATLRDEVTLLQADNDRYVQYSNAYTNYARDYQTWLSYLPTDENEVAQFASSVEALAREHGMEITLHFDDFPGLVATQGKNLYGIGTDIILQGSYQGLITFTADLQRLPYFYRIDKVTLTQDESSGGVDAALQGILYMRQIK